MREFKDGDKVYVAGEIFVWNPTQPHVDFKCYGLANGVSVDVDAIVPASAVPTAEQRAAVGRIVAEREAWQRYEEVSLTSTHEEGHRLWREWDALRTLIQPGDVEAARAVAEGGTNG